MTMREGRPSFEYNTLVEGTEICDADLEVLFQPSSARPMEPRFLIRMALDFSKLPEQNGLVRDDEAMLLVSFGGPDFTRVTPELYLSKSLEDRFKGPVASHIPPFLKDQCLMDYVPEVKAFVNEKVRLFLD